MLRVPKQENSEEGDGYQSVFTKLVALVQEKVIEGLTVLKMNDLRDTYVDLLDEIGIDAPNYRTEKLKAGLQKHFGDSLSFWQPNRKETEIVFSKTVSTGQAVGSMLTAMSCSGDYLPAPVTGAENGYNKPHQIFRSAQIIIGELHAVQNIMPWPPMPKELVENNVDIPDFLYNLLAWILYGDSDKEEVSDKKTVIVKLKTQACYVDRSRHASYRL